MPTLKSIYERNYEENLIVYGNYCIFFDKIVKSYTDNRLSIKKVEAIENRLRIFMLYE